MGQHEQTILDVKNYYGKVLQSTNDLKTSACCTAEAFPSHLIKILRQIDKEVLDRFYGCGSPIPFVLEGATVLDLGCGTGRDCYIFSKLVGEEGKVIGIDMTESQLEVARRHQESQAKTFGHSKSNVRFVQGYIEDLATAGIEDNSIDLVVSNCVLNLSPDKKRTFSEIMRVLKPGGELYFSDVFSDRRISEELQKDPVLFGECLSGALYTQDFRRIIQGLGYNEVRSTSSSSIDLHDEEVVSKIGMASFRSITYRIFKLKHLEDICEDYGQYAVYKGTIPESKHRFYLDDHHVFEAGKVTPVCGNTASMLQETRFSKHFEVHGDKSVHYGEFDCSPLNQEDSNTSSCC